MPVIYEGRVFSVEVDTVRLPNGRSHQVEIVHHRPSVVLIPLADRDHVIVIRQYRHSVRRELWEFPAGRVDPGESAEAAAVRECEEEIGLVPHGVERLCGLYPTPGYCDEEMIFFRLADLRPPPPGSIHAPDEDEDIHPRTVTLTEARAMVGRGDIIDLKTAYALTLI
jgi:ADP-ribose pyrophosphatase